MEYGETEADKLFMKLEVLSRACTPRATFIIAICQFFMQHARDEIGPRTSLSSNFNTACMQNEIP